MTRACLRALLAQPLAQFLIVGAALSGLHAALSPGPAREETAPDAIVVDAARLSQLEAQFARTWRRAPSEAELTGVVEAFVREEVLYRAGRALALGEEDPVIRRRIAQKMEFLLEPGPGEIAIGEADLAAHLAAHPERFRRPGRVAFGQVFLGSGPARDALRAQAAELRRRLDAGADPRALGEPTMLPAVVPPSPLREVARLFGAEFAAALADVPVGRWAGPIASGFGMHLVRIAERTPPRDPPLTEVRDAVRRDLEARRREEIAAARFEDLRSRYAVSVADLARPRSGGAASNTEAAR